MEAMHDAIQKILIYAAFLEFQTRIKWKTFQ